MKSSLVLADLHVHNYKENSTTLEGGVNSRCAEIVDTIDQAKKFAVGAGIDRALICGDLFHTRGNVRPSVQNAVADALRRMVNDGINVRIIPGNHDLENFRYGASACDILKGISDGWDTSVKVAPAGEVTYWAEDKIIAIPYIHDISDFKGALEQAAKDYPEFECVMMHQGIDDFAGHGYGETTITANYLRSVVGEGKLVFSGHYHTRGTDETKSIFSVGAICQHNFGDENDDRGFLVASTSAAGCTWFPTEAPKYVTISSEYIAKDEFGELEAEASGNFVRLITEDLSTVATHRKFLEDLGAKSVVVRVKKEFAKAHEETIELGKPEEMVAEYIEAQGSPYFEKKTDILDLFAKVCLT